MKRDHWTPEQRAKELAARRGYYSRLTDEQKAARRASARRSWRKGRDKYYKSHAAWKAKNPERYRRIQKNARLKLHYGISLEEYEQRYRDQNGCCATCSRAFSPEVRACLDHDHATGRIRGFLCDRCNKALGMVQDSKELLFKLAHYLG